MPDSFQALSKTWIILPNPSWPCAKDGGRSIGLWQEIDCHDLIPKLSFTIRSLLARSTLFETDECSPSGINCTRRQECIGLHHVGKSLAGQQREEVRLGNESKSFNVHGNGKQMNYCQRHRHWELDPVGSTVRYEMIKLCTGSIEDTVRR